MLKRLTIVFVLATLSAGVLAAPAMAAPPSVKIKAEPGTGCGTLPDTQSCINLIVTIKNYPPNPFAWTLYTRAKRSASNVYVTDSTVGVNYTGNLTFDITSNVCDSSQPWWLFAITGPDPLQSNVVRAC